MNGGRNRQKWIISILLLITVVAVGVAVWATFFRENSVELAPDYAPSGEEKHAEVIPNDSGDKMESPEGGGSVSLTYSDNVTISLKDETAKLLFANPGKSNQEMVLQIVIQDHVIVQSGILKPGKQVTVLELLDDATFKLSEGVYKGEFNVLYYDPKTGEKAVVNTEIPINITIEE